MYKITTSSLISSLFALLVFTVCAQVNATDKPHIQVIWGDDAGNFNVSAYNRGMMGYQTPNIEFPPRQMSASFSINQVMANIQAGSIRQ